MPSAPIPADPKGPEARDDRRIDSGAGAERRTEKSAPPRPIKLLIAEDNPNDVALIVLELRRAGFDPDWRCVDSETAFLEQLDRGLDVVLSDFQMPQFSGFRALELLQQSGLDVPFILVSGTIGEDTAVAAMKLGATDYLLKDRLARLGPAVTHALAETRLRRDRKHARQALIVSEARFASIFHANPSAVCITNLATGRIVDGNERLREFFGWSRAEVEGKTSTELGLWVEPAQRDALMTQLRATGSVRDAEVRMRRQDGQVRDVLVSMARVEVPGETEPTMISTFTDLTVRNQAAARLRLLESCIARLNDMVMVTEVEPQDEPGPRIVFVNDAFVRATGYTREEVIGRSPRFLQGPKTSHTERARIREALRQRKAVRAELINYAKSGVEYWVELDITPVADANGEVTHLVAVERDITERKRSEERYRRLVESNAQGVFFWNSSGAITGANAAFLKIVGYTQGDLTGRRMNWIAMTPPEYTELDRRMAGQIAANGVCLPFEKEYLRKDGSRVPVLLGAAAFADSPKEGVGFAVDLTERKELEAQFLQAQKMEAIGTLAGGIAHDFNNILTAIVGYAELGRMVLEGNPEVHEYLGAILQASNRASDLVRQILTFSRRERPERRVISLGPVLAESLKLLRSSLPASIEFDVSLASDAPTVLADATQIHQVLMNLGTNAWHAMKDHPGRLQVKLEPWAVDAVLAATQSRLRPGLYAHVSIGDTGCGMDEATLRRMFEPFFTTKPPGEGTGLGLAVVHGVMESHEGVVTVVSQPGEGTVFHLYFPAHIGESIASTRPDEPAERGQGECILVVDDEAILVRLMTRALLALGYQFEATTDPAVALEFMRAAPQRFALLLTDQTMPGMTGLALATTVRKIRPDLPVILMTGDSGSAPAGDIRAAGVRLILDKPMTVQALGVAVRTALTPQSAP